MNANAPNTASCTTCCVCCKEIPLDAAFTPEGAEYVEHFCCHFQKTTAPVDWA